MDSYNSFLSHFQISTEEFIDWGLNSIIFPEISTIDKAWEDLKNRIINNGKVYIRGYGRDAHGTELYKGFYTYALNNQNVTKDPTNNTIPRKLIAQATGIKNNQDIFNYQVAHIFGHTKNVFMFEAPWNICYIPKLFDPFTGHESKGEISATFRNRFITMAYKRHIQYIDDYNRIISKLSLNEKITEFTDMLYSNSDYSLEEVERFKADCIVELSALQCVE